MNLELTNTEIYNRALIHLESILNKQKKCLKDFPDMPIPTALSNNEVSNHLINEEQQYNFEELAQVVEKEIPKLNIKQKAIFEEIITAVETQTSAAFFIDGPGGTGKTFLYK